MSNFLFWHEQLLSMVVAYGVEDYIDGAQMVPSMYLTGTTVILPEYALWKRVNGTIHSWIYGSVTNEVSGYLYWKQSARDIWKTFEDVDVQVCSAAG